MSSQAFTRNYRDHSNDNGYQFEFFCDKCGNGFRSSFQTSGIGFAASMLRAAGSIFGGGLYNAGWGAQHVKDALRGPAWDSAFRAAIDECKPKFRQCTRCGKWVCPEVCWNQRRGLCEECAPDLAEEAAALQANVAVDQARDKAREVDQMRGFDIQSEAVSAAVGCRNCQASLAPGAKFCAQCGAPAEQTLAAAGPRFCAQCGEQLPPGTRFCAKCGRPAP
jgi:Double zinc ribbon